MLFFPLQLTTASPLPTPPRRLRDGLPVSDFAELHAAVHLAHKYQCPDVEAHALFVLKKYYTSDFAEHNAYSVSATTLAVPLRSSAIAAANIARLTETPSMLPFALYLACTLSDCVMDGYQRRDGSVEHLAADDLRRCIKARSELAWELARVVDTMAFQVGRVNVNSADKRGPDVLPFVGKKDSGMGVTNAREAVRGFTIETILATSVGDERNVKAIKGLEGVSNVWSGTQTIC